MKRVNSVLVFVFAAIGVIVSGLVGIAVIDNWMNKDEASVRAVHVEPAATVDDFLSITPRATWPLCLQDGGFDEQCEANFIASFEAQGVTMNASQREVVRVLIVPRIKELTARACDRATAAGLTSAQDLILAITEDVAKQSPRYAKAMASLIVLTKDNTIL
jgi:hypothetical protein